jgi:amino acid transporter
MAGAAVAMYGTSFYLKVQNWQFIFVYAGIAATIAALLSVSQAGFASSFNAFAAHYMGKAGDYYNSVASDATTSGWTNPGTTSLYGGLLSFVVLVGSFFSGPNAAQLCGEIRNPKRTYLVGSLAAAAFYVGFFGIVMALIYNTMGFNFLSAIDYLLYNNPSKIPLPNTMLPYVGVLAAIGTNSALATVIFITIIIQAFLFMPCCYLWMSRGLFVYSFDRLLPEWFSKVSDRTHGPLNAVFASAIIAEILFLIINIPQSATYAYLFASVSSLVEMFFPGLVMALLAIVVYVHRRKIQLYDSLPIKGWKLVGLGLALACFCMVCAYFLLTVPIYGANTPIGLSLVGGATIVFVVVYLVGWWRKRDLLELVFKQIPPE